MTLPGKGKIAFNMSDQQFRVQGSSSSPVISLGEWDAKAIGTASTSILPNAPFNVASKDLLSAYLPKEELKDAGSIVIDPAGTKKLPAKGWVTANGTRIRYALDDQNNMYLRVNDVKPSLDPIPASIFQHADDQGQQAQPQNQDQQQPQIRAQQQLQQWLNQQPPPTNQGSDANTPSAPDRQSE
jgi:hypothetical protein